MGRSGSNPDLAGRRRSWKVLFHRMCEKVPLGLDVQRLTKAVNAALLERQSEEQIKEDDIYQWRSQTGKSAKQLRVPRRAAVAHALVQALDQLGAWQSDRTKREEEMHELVRLLDFPWEPKPIDKAKADRVVKLFAEKRIVVALAVCPRDHIRRLWTMRDEKMRGMLANSLKRGVHYLCVTVLEQSLHSPPAAPSGKQHECAQDELPDELLRNQLPGLFRGELQALQDVIENTGEGSAIFAAMKKRLRFALLPATGRLVVYEYCHRGDRILFGAAPSGKDDLDPCESEDFADYLWQDYSALRGPENLQLVDNVEEPEIYTPTKPSYAADVHSWLELAAKSMKFFRLHRTIETDSHFRERMSCLANVPILEKVSPTSGDDDRGNFGRGRELQTSKTAQE